ncbi:hypothetical protein [Roseateles sp. BYS87W]|uniref:Uncharacterized protein n=1 Tax=Pelomonas baiyunensis TaxID=3299026 RepID=A0ABW7H0D1_9BURK
MNLKHVVCGAAVAVLACGVAQAKGGSKGGTHTSTHSSAASSGGNHSVSGYTKKDGTYVAPHHATNPNDSKRDNYSTKGNTNPYTGKDGTVDPAKKP